MKNKTVEKQINTLLKSEVIQFVDQFEDVDATLDMEYRVMDKQDTFSVVYTGLQFCRRHVSHSLTIYNKR